MQYLCLYTPAVNAGPPSAEHMAKMGKFIADSLTSGVLIATGGLTKSETGGFKATLSNGRFTFASGPFTDLLSKASGYAIVNAGSQQDLMKVIKDFLEIAGDGDLQILQIMAGPPPTD